MAKKTILTGIKPTGSPHLGNYIGAIKPALARSKDPEYFRKLYFIADYHALTSVRDPKQFKQLCYEVAATWLAMGLDPNDIILYLQSDVPEIFELNWLLACITSKGWMNRAHAYKAIVDKNREENIDDLDTGVNMGLYTYPILMASDILLFGSDDVPVGKDQVQHVEIARDMAIRFNNHYRNILKLPNYIINEDTAVIPGLDGRKMSKSYGNTIPLFAKPNEVRKLIAKIKTDSSLPHEPKDPNASNLFLIYKEFATEEQITTYRKRFEEGTSWADLKQELADVLDEFLTEPRRLYDDLMANPNQIEQLLKEGAAKARDIAQPMLAKVRKGIGKI